MLWYALINLFFFWTYIFLLAQNGTKFEDLNEETQKLIITSFIMILYFSFIIFVKIKWYILYIYIFFFIQFFFLIPTIYGSTKKDFYIQKWALKVKNLTKLFIIVTFFKTILMLLFWIFKN